MPWAVLCSARTGHRRRRFYLTRRSVGDLHPMIKLSSPPGVLCAITAICASLAHPACAQRVEDNVITQADDAFGANVGGADLGLYTPDSVRGFSPVAAGNIRIEGLSVDRQAEFTSRLVEGDRIHVGPSAQGYAFPAPTGIVDFQLRRPGSAPLLSVALSASDSGAADVEADGQLPLGDRFGVAGGIGLYRNEGGFGGAANVLSAAAVGSWKPASTIEVLPFASRIAKYDQQTPPIISPAGSYLPPRVSARRFIGQDWTREHVVEDNLGLVGQAASGGWLVRGGVFRSSNAIDGRFSDLLLLTTSFGEAQHSIIAAPEEQSGSTSAEVRVSRTFQTGFVRQTVDLMARGRIVDRLYAGAADIDLGVTSIFGPARVSRPDLSFGAPSRDRIRQVTEGAEYSLAFGEAAKVSLGLQHSQYSKVTEVPGQPATRTQDEPLLPTATAAVRIGRRLEVFGSFARGLEESSVAPDTAVNRDAAPPAIRTQQVDAGLRFSISDKLKLVATAFQIEKPYFDLDGARVFRRLGDERHRGVEASIAGPVLPGLTLLAGAVLLDATVSNTATLGGAVNARPVGVPSRTGLLSVDYRPGGISAWSVDASLTANSREVADVANSYFLPPQTSLSAGLRYRLALARAPALLRLAITNLLDTHAYSSVGSGAFSPLAGRVTTLSLVADF
jgi:iron complex outermembrane receptor protein